MQRLPTSLLYTYNAPLGPMCILGGISEIVTKIKQLLLYVYEVKLVFARACRTDKSATSMTINEMLRTCVSHLHRVYINCHCVLYLLLHFYYEVEGTRLSKIMMDLYFLSVY